jgi:hypothetical protein
MSRKSRLRPPGLRPRRKVENPCPSVGLAARPIDFGATKDEGVYMLRLYTLRLGWKWH